MSDQIVYDRAGPKRGPFTLSRETITRVWNLRGQLSAREISKSLGMTRNAVIGIWFRERQRRGEPPMRPVSWEKLTPEEIEQRREAKNAAKRARTAARRASAPPRPSPPPRVFKPITQARRAAAPMPESLGVLFWERRANQCAFIAGEPTHDATCCGHTTLKGFSYCPAHAAHCYRERPSR